MKTIKVTMYADIDKKYTTIEYGDVTLKFGDLSYHFMRNCLPNVVVYLTDITILPTCVSGMPTKYNLQIGRRHIDSIINLDNYDLSQPQGIFLLIQDVVQEVLKASKLTTTINSYEGVIMTELV
jgi:hypothetical protein